MRQRPQYLPEAESSLETRVSRWLDARTRQRGRRYSIIRLGRVGPRSREHPVLTREAVRTLNEVGSNVPLENIEAICGEIEK